MITMLKQGKDYITDKHGIYTEYVCSSAADVANLPTGTNSEAEDRPRPLDNNPITLLMLRSGKDVVVTPPDGFQLLTDEHNRILRDEQRNYLTDRKEVNTNG